MNKKSANKNTCEVVQWWDEGIHVQGIYHTDFCLDDFQGELTIYSKEMQDVTCMVMLQKPNVVSPTLNELRRVLDLLIPKSSEFGASQITNYQIITHKKTKVWKHFHPNILWTINQKNVFFVQSMDFSSTLPVQATSLGTIRTMRGHINARATTHEWMAQRTQTHLTVKIQTAKMFLTLGWF